MWKKLPIEKRKNGIMEIPDYNILAEDKTKLTR